MPRRPKARDGLSAGERAALYQAEQEEKLRRMNMGNESDRARGAKQPDDADLPVESVKKVKKEKKILPKPQHAVVKVDFSIPTGKIKPMHAMCNGPQSYGSDLTHMFREIGVPYVRFDETDGAYSSCAIDVSRIFKDMNADPSLEENYDFSQSDKYVAAAYNSGAKVIYRLGESRDRFFDEKSISVPENLSLYSKICANIVKHYNDYWADGFAYGIEYFEIWHHDKHLNIKDFELEFELYRRVAEAVKLVDGQIKVGGMLFEEFSEAAREFVKFCRKNRTPLDFISLSCFNDNIEEFGEELLLCIAYLKNMGFAQTEIVIGAWGYVSLDGTECRSVNSLVSPRGDSIVKEKFFDNRRSVRGAAYSAALMLKLNQIPEVSVACHYDAQPYISPWCDFADRFGNPEKPFYSFKAYGKLYCAKNSVLCISEQQDGFRHSGIYASAALSDKGEGFCYLASFGGCTVVDLRLEEIPDNVYSADIYMLDGVKNMTLADTVALSGMKKRLLLNISEYGAVLIKLY